MSRPAEPGHDQAESNARIVAKVEAVVRQGRTDPGLAQRLRLDPAGTLARLGVELPPGVRVEIVSPGEQPALIGRTLRLPVPPARFSLWQQLVERLSTSVTPVQVASALAVAAVVLVLGGLLLLTREPGAETTNLTRLSLVIHMPAGQAITLEVAPDAPLEQLLAHLAVETGIPADELRLWWEDIELAGERSPLSYGIPPGAELRLEHIRATQ